MKPSANATIRINDLKIRAIIGTMDHERVSPQDVLAQVSFDYDAALAATTDALGHAVDYAAIHDAIIERCAATKFFLLERLAAFILDIVMEDVRIARASVSLEKVSVLSNARSVSVTLSADRAADGVKTNRCY